MYDVRYDVPYDVALTTHHYHTQQVSYPPVRMIDDIIRVFIVYLRGDLRDSISTDWMA